MTTNAQEKMYLETISKELGETQISLNRLIEYIYEEGAFKELNAAFEHLHLVIDAYDKLIIPELREES